MKLIDDWRSILKRALSIKFILAAGFFSGAETAIQLFSQFGSLPAWMPRGGFALLGFIASMGALLFRIVAQKGLSDGHDK